MGEWSRSCTKWLTDFKAMTKHKGETYLEKVYLLLITLHVHPCKFIDVYWVFNCESCMISFFIFFGCSSIHVLLTAEMCGKMFVKIWCHANIYCACFWVSLYRFLVRNYIAPFLVFTNDVVWVMNAINLMWLVCHTDQWQRLGPSFLIISWPKTAS